MTKRFAGKVAIIAGASGGIGQAIARRLVSEGASVALLARRKERLDELAGELRQVGATALPVPCDVLDPAAVASSLSIIQSELGTVQALINCIGQELVAPFSIYKDEDLQRMADANLRGIFGLTREVGRAMLRQKSGTIVNVTSIVGQVGSPAMALYGAFKSAVLGWSRCLAMEWAPYGIRVNALACGLVRTEMFGRITARLTKEETARIEQSYPMGFGLPEDVAASVAFLASQDARWITGAVLTLDGGFTAR